MLDFEEAPLAPTAGRSRSLSRPLSFLLNIVYATTSRIQWHLKPSPSPSDLGVSLVLKRWFSVSDYKLGKPLNKLPEELSLSSTSSSSDLYSQLASSSKTSIHRLRITKGSDGSFIPNTSSLPVPDTGLRDGSTIYVKDLGTLSLPLLPLHVHQFHSAPYPLSNYS